MDLSEAAADDAALFKRGLFLVGEYDPTGEAAASILAKQATGNERFFMMLGVLGALVGKDERNAIILGSVTVTAETLP